MRGGRSAAGAGTFFGETARPEHTTFMGWAASSRALLMGLRRTGCFIIGERAMDLSFDPTTGAGPPRRSAAQRLRNAIDALSRRTASQRPSELIFGLDEVPPLHVVLLGGLQHVGLVTIFLIYPLLVIDDAGVTVAEAATFLSFALISLGIATLVQGLPRGPVGSGFLCPANHTAVYLAPSLAALRLGGVPLLLGMTMVAGALECALSTVLQRIRPLIPPELSGLVIFFVGMTVASIGFRYVADLGSPTPWQPAHLAVAAVTLGLTAALNVWAKGNARVFCALIGIVAGYLAAIVAGVLTAGDLAAVTRLPLVALPAFDHAGWSFDPEMLPPFLIAGLAATLKAVGVISVCQRINDEAWVRPDMASLSRGVLADGLGTMIAGIIGSVGVNTSTPCTGLSAATGVTSRAVGFAAGAMLAGLGFLPMIAGMFVLMPRPVMGGALIFAACFILINGLQTIAARMLDARRTLVIGLALSAGLVAEMSPDMADTLPLALKPIVSSSLVLGTVTALVLNLLFRLGQRQAATLVVGPDTADPLGRIGDFFETQGRAWGARRDVMKRATFGVSQAVETIRDLWGPDNTISIETTFDEFRLDVALAYRGDLMELPERRPSDKEIMESEAGQRRLAGYMLRRNADGIAASRIADDCILRFRFDH